MRLKTPYAMLLALAVGAACDVAGLEELDLTGSLTASPTSATVGQNVTVVIEAEGTRLLSFFIDYADGTDPDFLSVAGSRTARWTRTHVFEAPGSYVIVGRIDEVSDTLTRTVTVTVTDPAARVPAVAVPFRAAARE